IRNDRLLEEAMELFGQDGANMDIAIPLGNMEKSYDGFFPSAHYRYELDENTLIRASLWTSFTRPSFDQARGYGEIVGRVVLCNPETDVCTDNPKSNGGTINQDRQIVTTTNGNLFSLDSNNTLRLGNPELIAMTSANFDTSISWYGDNGDHWQVAAFYKDIDDFIVEVRGASLAFDQMPFDLPVEQLTQFHIDSDLVIDNT